MKKQTILTIIIYLLAFGINFFASIKYPDSTITVINLVISIVFMMTIILGLKSVITSKKNKYVKIIMISGTVSSIFVFIASEFQYITYKYTILDVITNIHYPLYLIFVTPLFGINYIFNVSYGVLSAIISVLYLTGFCSMLYLLKKH